MFTRRSLSRSARDVMQGKDKEPGCWLFGGVLLVVAVVAYILRSVGILP